MATFNGMAESLSRIERIVFNVVSGLVFAACLAVILAMSIFARTHPAEFRALVASERAR